jgi:hypothetical protein
MYIPEITSRNYTVEPDIYPIETKLLVICLALALTLALLRLGKRLLPDLAGAVVVQVGEQKVEDF